MSFSNEMKAFTVIDFFCGAGGFSEGFKQQGFQVINGYDIWKPAVDTYCHNFNGKATLKNILDFENSIQAIEEIPNTDIIIGSPPCVSFSNSNRSGKADKSMGLRLTEIFLKIIAVKKYSKNSCLKVWLMENVPNSLKFIKSTYSFVDLGLTEWAINNNLPPDKIALNIKGNNYIINSADYGSPQIRKRAITGEFIDLGKLIVPDRKFRDQRETGILPIHRTLGLIKQSLPSPFSSDENKFIKDPIYDLSIPQKCLTDHFYDTGLYECEWECSRFHKVNHPYMGLMSFPENESKPSRTICATNIGTSRESLIYRSELKRKGNGEYRTPTVREGATIMGFPLSFQFVGSEGAKYRLVGNAVSPCVSRAFAEKIRDHYNLGKSDIIVPKDLNLNNINNLNNWSLKNFNNPPKKKKGSRFRRHPFKHGNITVTLSNYDIKKSKRSKKWITSVQYGNGEGFPTYNYPDNFYIRLEDIIQTFEKGKEFLQIINNGFSECIANSKLLQEMYDERISIGNYLEPTELIKKIAEIINTLGLSENDTILSPNVFYQKEIVPKKQVMALYAINKVTSIANQ